MARIAYVDHSFHQKTLSNNFLPDLLQRQGHTVDFFWCERWRQGLSVPFDAVRAYDAVIMFQVQCCPLQYYVRKHPNVTFVPMLDSYGTFTSPKRSLAWDFEPFQGSKILNFSKAIHHIAIAFGIHSLPVRYYQPPIDKVSEKGPGLHGFFWLRDEKQVSWPTVRALIGQTPFASMHLHIAPDPGSPEPTMPTQEECEKFSISTSTWFDVKEDFYRQLDRANIFFAPRQTEGIGQSFLEAMARCQCVVAPDRATMNEYILHGVNGLLYDSNIPRPLDFSHVDTLGINAYESVKAGHAAWQMREKEVADFILAPSGTFYTKAYKHPPLMRGQRFPEHSDGSEGRKRFFYKLVRSIFPRGTI